MCATMMCANSMCANDKCANSMCAKEHRPFGSTGMSNTRSRVELDLILLISKYKDNAIIDKLNGIPFEMKSQL